MENENNTNMEDATFYFFARMHPLEAFDLDKKRFCRYLRQRFQTDIDDKTIEDFINQYKLKEIFKIFKTRHHGKINL